MTKHITVFDFDGTLTQDDTFISFARHCVGTWNFVLGVFRAFPYLLSWKIGLCTGGKAKQKLYSALFKGKRKCDIEQSALTFRPKYRQEVLKMIEEQRSKGEILYIISASLDLWLKPIAEELRTRLICTETSTDAYGRLDGRFSTSNCYGEEKLKRLIKKEGKKDGFILTVIADEPGGGDAALFAVADNAVIV